MRRRKFLQLAGGAAIAWPLPALAQQGANLPLVAALLVTTEDGANERVAALRDGLKQAGLVEGTHYALTMRFANGDVQQLPKLAKELDALKPRVFVTAAVATGAVRRQSPDTPLVFTGVAVDVVAIGLVQSYAKPGGVGTGNVQNAVGGEEGISTKRIGIFKELVPGLNRLGMIGFDDYKQPSVPSIEHNALRKASSQLGFEVIRYDLPDPLTNHMDFDGWREALASAVASGVRDDVNAFYLSGAFVIGGHIPEVTAILAKTGKPICSVYPDFARAGSLMSYSIDIDYGFRLTGIQVAKILRGARPGDLPIEQADKFTLAINLKTAKQLGITVPSTLLAQADEVIE
jgi:putative tryptophan/tyrosine transport system substrate-binding protein